MFSKITRRVTYLCSTFLFTLIFNQILFSQATYEPPKLISPSPNVAALLAYVQTPVNKNTGIPNISIPLYTIKAGSLELPISLSYFAGGIRANQEASSVGLGWALNAGGIISHEVRGEDDLQGAGFPFTAPLPENLPVGWRIGDTYDNSTAHLVHILHHERDGEPDLFCINAGPLSGKFYLKKKILEDDFILGSLVDENVNLRIRYYVNAEKWVITDPQGVNYHFSTKEYSGTEMSSSGNNGLNEIEDFNITGDYCDNNSPSVSAWYLDSIVSNGDKIIFHYLSADFCSGIVSQPGIASGNIYNINSLNVNVSPTYYDNLRFKSITQAVTLDNIEFPNGKVTFLNGDRLDLLYYGNHLPTKVDKILISDVVGNLLRKPIEFHYSYFNNTTVPDFARLCLDSVLTEEAPYRFSYNSESLPNKRTKSLDHWGYYNGKPNKTLLPFLAYNTNEILYPNGADRNPDADMMKVGMLQTIEYPTGGKELFEFEPHDYFGTSPILETSGADVESNWDYYSYMPYSPYKEETFYVPEETVLTFYAFGGINKPCNMLGGYQADVPYAVLVSVPDLSAVYSSIEEYHYSNVLAKASFSECNGTDPINESKTISLTVQPGWYRIVTESQFINSFAKCQVRYKHIVGYNNGIMAGGLRVKKIKTISVNNENVRKFEYVREDNPSASSGMPLSNPIYTVSIPMLQIDPAHLDQMYTMIPSYSMRSSSFTPLSTLSGSYVVYDRVVEVLGTNGEGGKIVSTFSNIPAQELPYNVPAQDVPGNGVLLSEKVFDAQGNMLKKIENEYVVNDIKPLYQFSIKIFHSPYVGTTDVNYPPPPFYLPIGYYVFSGKSKLLLKTTTTTYHNSQVISNSITNHYKNFSNRPYKKVTINSKGDEIVNRDYFVDDYTVGTDPAFSPMIEKNMVNVPVETQQWFKRGGVEYLKSSMVVQYKKDPESNYISPYKVFGLEASSALNGSSVGLSIDNVSQRTSLMFNSSLFKERLKYDYTSKGRIKNVTINESGLKSYLWGYKNAYPITESINAKENEIFFDGFEESGTWEGVVYDASKSHTGKYSGRINNSGSSEIFYHSLKWLNVSNTSAKKYKYSGWVYSNGPSVQLFLLMKNSGETGYVSYADDVSTTVTGKWVYLEKEFDVPSSVTQLNIRVDNNGGGTVWYDDIRLHPADAQMTTYTYTPLIGITSQSDVNNVPMYYEYDDFTRLLRIRDKDNNILKQYDYKYQVPSRYYNTLISGTFTRKNCNNGYQGVNYIYIVSAGQYSSVESQAAADLLAQNDVNANGQNMANQYGNCALIYYNVARDTILRRNNCGSGYQGGSYTYSVSAGKYSSLLSQAEANQLALNDIVLNAQNAENQNGTCSLIYYNIIRNTSFTRNNCSYGGTPSTVIYTVAAGKYSSIVSQAAADQQAIEETSANGQGYANANGSCMYYNTVKTGSFTRNNCMAGYNASTITYTIAGGAYSSTVSQAVADSLATNALNISGQAYANINGTCTYQCNYATCSGISSKCVNGNCEIGIKVYTSSVDYLPGTYLCTYHYEWSDGIWSSNYSEISSYKCVGGEGVDPIE